MSESKPQIDDDALAEALEQLSAIDADEDSRRRAADSKIGAAQNALGFTVTLAGGSSAYAFLQSPQYDLWHILALTALVASVVFFLRAAFLITAANEPRPYQSRTANGIQKMLRERRPKRELQIDAINDLTSNINANLKATDARLSLYIDAQAYVRWAMIALAMVPLVILIGYGANALFGSGLPKFLTITSTQAQASPNKSTP